MDSQVQQKILTPLHHKKSKHQLWLQSRPNWLNKVFSLFLTYLIIVVDANVFVPPKNQNSPSSSYPKYGYIPSDLERPTPEPAPQVVNSMLV